MPTRAERDECHTTADFPLVAFTVPADADFAGIKALLAQGQEEGWWHYEVGCGTAEWWNA